MQPSARWAAGTGGNVAHISRAPGPGLDRLKKLQADISGLQTKVGWFETDKYEAAPGQPAVPVAYVAAIQEHGVPERSIPARPFMRPTAAERRNYWRDQIQAGAKAAVNGNAEIKGVFEALGLRVVGDIQKTISQIQDPPLSLTTLLLRQHKQQGGNVTGKTVGAAFHAAAFLPGQSGPEKKAFNIGKILGVSTKPLVFTRHMINTLTSTTDRKGQQ